MIGPCDYSEARVVVIMKRQVAEADLVSTCDDSRTTGIDEKADFVVLRFIHDYCCRASL